MASIKFSVDIHIPQMMNFYVILHLRDPSRPKLPIILKKYQKFKEQGGLGV